jgi:hypothetical protein
MCSRLTRHWATIHKAILALFGYISIPYSIARLINKRRWLADVATTLDTETIILSAALLHCSNDHDKVYRVLNLLDPVVSKLITPDYNTSIAVAYQNLVLAIAQTTGTLNLVRVGS